MVLCNLGDYPRFARQVTEMRYTHRRAPPGKQEVQAGSARPYGLSAIQHGHPFVSAEGPIWLTSARTPGEKSSSLSHAIFFRANEDPRLVPHP
jgi:hypothetical protein